MYITRHFPINETHRLTGLDEKWIRKGHFEWSVCHADIPGDKYSLSKENPKGNKVNSDVVAA